MIQIRKADSSDLPTLAKLEREFFRDQRGNVLNSNPKWKPYLKHIPDRQQYILRSRMKKWVGSRNARVVVAESEGTAVGFATASIEPKAPPLMPFRYGFIGYVFVRRKYRGQRISSVLMESLLAWLAKRNVKRVSLTVINDNRPARAIWKKWGFEDFLVFAWKVD